MSYIFGPVPSRRLGLSLGIDLVPIKTCSYNCLYCQVGLTTDRTIDVKPYAPIEEVVEELQKTLQQVTPDTITLSGSGEPTLHSEIDQIIAAINRLTNTRIALLTNGSLLWRKEVRKRILEADIVVPTLSTVFNKTFEAIHKPHGDLSLSRIIDGLIQLRKEYRGRIFLEVFFIAGINDSNDEVAGLKEVIGEISPDRIQLNTVMRPPSDSQALALDRERLEEIRSFFGDKAEIIADSPTERKEQQYASQSEAIIEMARRRPIRAVDAAEVLNVPLQGVQELLETLVQAGRLRLQEHSGEGFYLAA